MIKNLDEIMGTYRAQKPLAPAKGGLYNKMPSTGQEYTRSVEYDCDSGDSCDCDGGGSCDAPSCDSCDGPSCDSCDTGCDSE